MSQELQPLIILSYDRAIPSEERIVGIEIAHPDAKSNQGPSAPSLAVAYQLPDPIVTPKTPAEAALLKSEELLRAKFYEAMEWDENEVERGLTEEEANKILDRIDDGEGNSMNLSKLLMKYAGLIATKKLPPTN